MGRETPVADLIREYRERGALRLHMPGHKGIGEPEARDITEIEGAEPLYSGRGVLRESEENAARLFGAGRTVYSAEGSSLCIRAMLFLAKLRAEERGIPPVILAGRNAHRAFLSGAALLGLEPRWLRGQGLLTCMPSAEELADALDGRTAPPAAVYVTSPDYLGNRADIRALAGVCRARGVPLLVDNAHGAYLRFLEEDLHPLSLGADMTCDSAHKTLPALTGAAYLHIRRGADPVFAAQADRAMALFASTSPSWLILESLDRCNALLGGGWAEELRAFVRKTGETAARLRDRGMALAGSEPMKISVEAGKYGYTGTRMAELLRAEGIECEFADPDYLVLMPAPAVGEEGLRRLENALSGIPRREARREKPPALPVPEPVMSLRAAMTAPAEDVPAERSWGRVLADPCVSCPPAVPVLVSGERIGPDALRCFRYYGIERVSCVREPARTAAP